jgi:hypothetical protein
LSIHNSLFAQDPAGIEFFEAEIRSVFLQHCYECHSADAKNVKGGLLLDSREATRKGGDSGPADVPKNVDESLLIDALRHDSSEMPPKGRLPDSVIPNTRLIRFPSMRTPMGIDSAAEGWTVACM